MKFKVKRPYTIAIMGVDWDEHLGLRHGARSRPPAQAESRGTRATAGSILRLSDGTVTDSSWKAQSFYIAPLNKPEEVVERRGRWRVPARHASRSGRVHPVATKPDCREKCYAVHYPIPASWPSPRFNDAHWPRAYGVHRHRHRRDESAGLYALPGALRRSALDLVAEPRVRQRRHRAQDRALVRQAAVATSLIILPLRTACPTSAAAPAPITLVCCRREARPRLAVSTNVFYEEEGDFKVGAVLADNDASLQVEAPHGKRSKVKAANVLLRFEGGGLGGLHGRGAASSPRASTSISCGNAAARTSSPSTRWRATTSAARPCAVESAALLIKLHGAPMYFYKKGKGRYKAAPEEALKAALASVERKRQQAEQRAALRRAVEGGQAAAGVRSRCSTSCSTRRTGTPWSGRRSRRRATRLKLSPARLHRALRRACLRRTTTT